MSAVLQVTEPINCRHCDFPVDDAGYCGRCDVWPRPPPTDEQRRQSALHRELMITTRRMWEASLPASDQ